MPPPVRRRPGSSSPIVRLEPQVEAVKTPARREERAIPEATPAVEPEPPAVQVAPAVVAPSFPAPVERKPVTLPMPVDLKKRIETAILRTQAFPEGHPSFTAFMNSAAARELARLEAQYNDGEPFEPNPGRFRQGRPIA